MKSSEGERKNKQITNDLLSLHLKFESKINCTVCVFYFTDIEGLFYLDFVSFIIAAD